MTSCSVSIKTRDGHLYEGILVSGTFVFDGNNVGASRISSLDLPEDVQAGSPLPGRLCLADGTTFLVPATRHGWFERTTTYNIEGTVTLHVDSIGSEVTVDVRSVEHMYVRLRQNDPDTRLALKRKFLTALESWLEANIISHFGHDEVRFSGIEHWHLEADLTYGGDPALLPSTKLALRRVAMAFGEELASSLGLQFVDAIVDDYGPKVRIELSR